MAWAWVGASSSVEVTTTSHTLLEPAGVAIGDLLVAIIVYRSTSTTSITLPAGWQLVGEQKNNNVVAAATTSVPSAMMAYIVRGASAPSYTFTHAAAPSVALGGVVAYRGGAASSVLDTATSFTTATNVTAISGAGLTTTQANDLLVGIAVSGRQATFINFNATSPGTSSGSGTGVTAAPAIDAWAERFDVLTPTGADVSTNLVDAVKSAAGATGSMVCTASVAAGNVVIVGAFKIAVSTISGTLNQTLGAMTALGTGNVYTESFVRETEDGLAWRTTEDGLLRRTEGSVFVPLTSCTLAVTLNDMTAAGTGTVANQVYTGTLNQTLGALTGTLTGKVTVGGTAAGTLLPMTVVGTGTVVNQVFSGTLAATLDFMTGVGTGTVTSITSSGTLAATLDAMTALGTGTVANQVFTGTANVTLGALTGTLSGKVTVGGTAAGTLAAASLVATGTVANQVFAGTLAQTLDAMQVSSVGVVTQTTRTGTLAVTLGTATLAGVGTVFSPTRIGTLAATLDAVTLSATDVLYAKVRLTEDGSQRTIEGVTGNIRVTEGQVRLFGTVGVTLNDATLVASGKMSIKGTVGVTLGALTGTLTGRVAVKGTAAGTLLPLALVGTGTVKNQVFSGGLDRTLGDATLAAFGTVIKPLALGVVKVWNGAAWTFKPVKIWNGTTWSAATLKYWDGVKWVARVPPSSGALAVVLDDLTGMLRGGPVAGGQLNGLLGNLTVTLSGRVAVGGSYVGTLFPATVIANATAVNQVYSGTLSKTLDNVALTATGTVVTVAFSPISLGGLAVWLDADQLPLMDGAAVLPWPNMGSDSTPSIVGSPAPVFKAGIAPSGKGAVRFSTGLGRVRGLTSVVQDYTILYVSRLWGTAGGRAYSGAYPESGNFLIGYWTTQMDIFYDEGFVGSAISPVNTWKLYGADGTTSGGYNARFYVNGVNVGSKAGGSGVRGYYHLSGYNLTGAEETGDFDIAELLIYNRQLSDADRMQVENYLRTKWGLP